jgi:hypothetical protein
MEDPHPRAYTHQLQKASLLKITRFQLQWDFSPKLLWMSCDPSKKGGIDGQGHNTFDIMQRFS